MTIRNTWLALAACLTLTVPAAYGQMGMGGGPAGHGPKWGGKIAKVFGEHPSFTAKIQMQTKGSSSAESMSVPGQLAYDQGKSRFEMNLLESAKMPPEAMAHMKSMGMDRMVVITRPDKKVSYMVYPGLQAYVETATTDESDGGPNVKMDIKETGKETVDGHPTVKNQVVITDDKGDKFEGTVWNATDLKKFPIKIEQVDQGTTTVISFSDVKFDKPAADTFEPPSNLKRYDSMQALMQNEMLKRMNRQGLPPGHP